MFSRISLISSIIFIISLGRTILSFITFTTIMESLWIEIVGIRIFVVRITVCYIVSHSARRIELSSRHLVEVLITLVLLSPIIQAIAVEHDLWLLAASTYLDTTILRETPRDSSRQIILCATMLLPSRLVNNRGHMIVISCIFKDGPCKIIIWAE